MPWNAPARHSRSALRAAPAGTAGRVALLTAEQQRVLETWQLVLRARQAIDRYRAHLGAIDADVDQHDRA
jgi:hypothetical protein